MQISILDFRDSFFPYIGLIVTVVIFVAVIIPAIFMNHKKTLFWSIGNLVGYYIGWLLLLAIGPAIAEALINFIPDIGGGISKDAFKPMLEEIIPIIWFFIFLPVWNALVLVLNYHLWYKRVFHLRKGMVKVKTKEKHGAKQIQIKIGMILVSLVGYAPIAFSVGNIVESFTVSQTNANKTNKGVAQTFDTMSTITYTHGMRPNVDALQAVLTLVDQNAFTVVGNSFTHFLEFNPPGGVTSSQELKYFKDYINTNFVRETSPNAAGDDIYFHAIWLDEENYGMKIKNERTITSLLSQMMLPKAVATAIPTFISSLLDDSNKISFDELTKPTIPLEIGDEKENWISIKDFIKLTLPSKEGGDESGATIQMPINFDDPDPANYETYHLKLFKEGTADYRVKLLKSTYDSVSDAIINAIAKSTPDDDTDLNLLKDMAKEILVRIFFTDADPDGQLYTKASQISSGF